MNILIIGSNFGFKVYYKALNLLKVKKTIIVCSPNIKKKLISKKTSVHKSFEEVIQKYKNFNLIICATRPDIQRKVISFLYKSKKLPKNLVLEKPVSNNILETIKILKKINNKKTKIFSNFIFSKIDNFIKLKKLLKNKKIKTIHYEWYFKQAYFVNKIKTWKINPKLGGGLIYYYLIHVISNLRFIWKLGNKFSKIKVERKNKILYSISLLHKYKNTKIIIQMNCNSNKNLHQITCNLENNITYKLSNKSSDWTKNFILYKNNKQVAKKSVNNRIKLTKLNLFEGIYKYKNQKEELIMNNKLTHNLYKKII